MCPDSLAPLANRRGIGLVTAIFALVVLSLFGLLIARYTVTTQIASGEDYLWAQSLYSAESVMRLNILRNDQGGTLPAKPALVQPAVGQIPTAITSDNFTLPGAPATIRVRATDPTGVSREVESKYIL
ncbi:MAG: hypothetical protein AB1413_00190 [Thermodesulfobacteriota bacterium]